jgi:hypothetical protein
MELILSCLRPVPPSRSYGFDPLGLGADGKINEYRGAEVSNPST